MAKIVRKRSYKKVVSFVVIVLLLIGGGIVWRIESTKDIRKQKTDYKNLVKFAQRQAVEIAIIEQASKLANYKQQISQNQNPAPQPFQPPVISDPKDVNDGR